MIIRARVQDGVVVLEPGASLPEGTEVTVGVCAATNATGEKMSDKQRRRIREIVDRIIALPTKILVMFQRCRTMTRSHGSS